MPRPTTTERFWNKVDKSGPIPLRKKAPGNCWLWLSETTDNGYGRFFANKRKVMAYRWSYERFVGAIPEGLQLDHLCRTPACVNPNHLEPVTPRENVRRGSISAAARERQLAKSHCPRGHAYSGDNLYVRPSDGARQCRTCNRRNERAKRAAA